MPARLSHRPLPLLAAIALCSCVPTAEKRATNPESAATRLPTPTPASAATRLAATPDVAGEARPSPRPGQRHVAGYWHWDGVRHVWIAGHLEPERATYTWQPGDPR